jgi:hypothetical protein
MDIAFRKDPEGAMPNVASVTSTSGRYKQSILSREMGRRQPSRIYLFNFNDTALSQLLVSPFGIPFYHQI